MLIIRGMSEHNKTPDYMQNICGFLNSISNCSCELLQLSILMIRPCHRLAAARADEKNQTLNIHMSMRILRIAVLTIVSSASATAKNGGGSVADGAVVISLTAAF